MKKSLDLRLKFFDNTPIGRLVTRTISDVETLSNVFSDGMAAIAGDILQLTLIIAVMFYTDWKLSIISLVDDSADAFLYLCFQGKDKRCF